MCVLVGLVIIIGLEGRYVSGNLLKAWSSVIAAQPR